jgi:hypothetical protein
MPPAFHVFRLEPSIPDDAIAGPGPRSTHYQQDTNAVAGPGPQTVLYQQQLSNPAATRERDSELFLPPAVQNPAQFPPYSVSGHLPPTFMSQSMQDQNQGFTFVTNDLFSFDDDENGLEDEDDVYGSEN